MTLPELLARRQEIAAKLAEVDVQILATAVQPAPAQDPDSLITMVECAERLGIKSSYAYSLARRELVLMGKVVSAGIDPETGMTMWRALPKGGDR
jgi:hypothetical protein